LVDQRVWHRDEEEIDRPSIEETPIIASSLMPTPIDAISAERFNSSSAFQPDSSSEA